MPQHLRIADTWPLFLLRTYMRRIRLQKIIMRGAFIEKRVYALFNKDFADFTKFFYRDTAC